MMQNIAGCEQTAVTLTLILKTELRVGPCSNTFHDGNKIFHHSSTKKIIHRLFCLISEPHENQTRVINETWMYLFNFSCKSY